MNSRLKDIFARRSIRAYNKENISPETVRDILEAAMSAPSACNKQPWEFITIDKQKILQDIKEYLPHGKFLDQASHAIVVCGNINNAHKNDISYMLMDCSASIQNILLAASMLGLGTCWIGIFPVEERVSAIKAYFKLPEHIIPIAAIPIGYPEETPEARTQYNHSKIHINSWR